VLDDFGRSGRSWRETDEDGADRETMIRDLMAGQYNGPVRVVAFNTVEGWSRDVSVDIADELRRRFVEYDEVPKAVIAFMEATRGLLGHNAHSAKIAAGCVKLTLTDPGKATTLARAGLSMVQLTR
jgi:hypothetical protein